MARFKHSYWVLAVPLIMVAVATWFFAFNWPAVKNNTPVEATGPGIDLGLVYLPVTGTVPACFQLEVNSGAMITEVAVDSLLDQYGVKPGDVIMKFNGVRITPETPLLGLLRSCHPGDDISLEVWSSNGVKVIEISDSSSRSQEE